LKHTPLDAITVGCSYIFELSRIINSIGQYFNCATIAFSERYNLARELEDKVMKNERIPVGNVICFETELLESPVLPPAALTSQMWKMASHILQFMC
jgi:hypothetical protein